MYITVLSSTERYWGVVPRGLNNSPKGYALPFAKPEYHQSGRTAQPAKGRILILIVEVNAQSSLEMSEQVIHLESLRYELINNKNIKNL